jgi:hypothetical protein
MKHKKHNARQSSAEKIAARDHLPEEPAMPGSVKEVSQGRFPGETPLTGEDRPIDSPGDKQEGLGDPADRAAAGHIPGRQAGNPTQPQPWQRHRLKTDESAGESPS